MNRAALSMACNPDTGLISSVKLFDQELLHAEAPCPAELFVNGLPLKTRLHLIPGQKDPLEYITRVKGERFVDHFSGWGLVVHREMGLREYAQHPCWGLSYTIRRELADQIALPCPGPGGPVVEAPLHVDTFSLLNLNWKFWGDETRMIFPSLHSNGPADEFGHVGYENDTPEKAKAFLQNVWRRIYPGNMGIHGGVFYNERTQHWIALTCRRPHVGYILNLENAGRGIAYDFTLHAPFKIGDWLRMPEIKIYFGETRDEMNRWMADYITHYYEEPPEWVHKTLFGLGLAWNNQPNWNEQATHWEKELETQGCNGIGYCLVTNRPIKSGTLPLGYEPDPNHGTQAEFKAMCQRMTKLGVPLLTWMSHSGMQPGAPDISDDWFIRGIDGRLCASWGNADNGMYHINPGHPGYIEYTKKWIRFYIKECGCKGIFLDCLGWAFPPDFTPRSFMRYPGDTNLVSIKFIEEIYAELKACDPDAILLGEGTTLDAPVNVYSICANPVRATDGMGPRDFLLNLNQFARKRMVLDQGPTFFPAQGYTLADPRPEAGPRNKRLAKLLKEKGGRNAFLALPGDLSVHLEAGLLIVPSEPPRRDIALPKRFEDVIQLTNDVTGEKIKRDGSGAFKNIETGMYQMVRG